jgi:hypothetical protein
MSVRQSYHRTAFHEILCLSIYRKSVDKIQVSFKSCNNNWHFTLRPIHSFDKIYKEICTENQNTHFTSDNYFSENRAVYEIMWKNTADPDRSQMTIRRMRSACWKPKATNTHSEYVTLIAFPLQQWLLERASM